MTHASPNAQTVAEIGEFGLIRRLVARIEPADRDPLAPPSVGEMLVGDDAALWTPEADRNEVLTTDTLVEGVHFRTTTTSWGDLGWKAMAQNISDVAAMGARPTLGFVTLGIPRHTRVADLDELYDGIGDCLHRFGARLAGGDTVSSPIVFISVTVVGQVAGPGLRRGAARPGDALAVTGTLGDSIAGLEILESAVVTSDSFDTDAAALVSAHRRPTPRVAEAQCLAEHGVRAGMDLSDGLLGDVGKLAFASGLSALIEIDRLPVSSALVHTRGNQARATALAGGEDFELLVAGPEPLLRDAGATLNAQGLAHLTLVGSLAVGQPGAIKVVDSTGRLVRVDRGSWDHFKTEPPRS
ncbi:MAG: thiamine-phosphate kinase [Chloroflexota bacterium]